MNEMRLEALRAKKCTKLLRQCSGTWQQNRVEKLFLWCPSWLYVAVIK